MATWRIFDRAHKVLRIFGAFDQRAHDTLGPRIEGSTDQTGVIVGDPHESGHTCGLRRR
jgi:hypothetical protein